MGLNYLTTTEPMPPGMNPFGAQFRGLINEIAEHVAYLVQMREQFEDLIARPWPQDEGGGAAAKGILFFPALLNNAAVLGPATDNRFRYTWERARWNGAAWETFLDAEGNPFNFSSEGGTTKQHAYNFAEWTNAATPNQTAHGVDMLPPSGAIGTMDSINPALINGGTPVILYRIFIDPPVPKGAYPIRWWFYALNAVNFVCP